MKTCSVVIAGRRIGQGSPCFVIAEAGVNHNGSIRLARKLVAVAAQAGADAVKFQTFRPDKLVTPTAPQAEYQRRNTGRTETQYEMLKKLELPPRDHLELKAYSRKQQVLFLSTPFDEDSADYLDKIGLPAFKMASGELTNLPFLEHVARKRKPMIVSTGMSTMAEVGAAVDVIRKVGNHRLILLHCVSEYPTEPVDANLLAMETMAREFKVPIGYSDHTLGIEVALAAVARGACVLEKHFTLNQDMAGPDHRASLPPAELRALVRGIRKVEVALGHGEKKPTRSELKTAEVARKSLVVVVDVPVGATIRRDMLVAMRPGTGIPPSSLGSLIGKRVRMAVQAGTILRPEHFTTRHNRN